MMIRRIVVILVAALLQLAATACSPQRQSTHTVCPEASMTLSSSRHGDYAPMVGELIHQKASLTHPCTEAFAAQSQSQARVNYWQWQRMLRDAAKSLLASDNSRCAVSVGVCSRTFGIDSQSIGYVYVIRHIVI